MAHHAPPIPFTADPFGVTETPDQRNRDRAAAIRALTGGEQMVYACRLVDGIIKIGCTGDLASRLRTVGSGAELLGFMPGDFADERAIHQTLTAHRARGREYYHPTPAVLAVVNEMRDRFDLPHL